MQYRRFGRTEWQVSELGHGTWAMGGQWSGSDDAVSLSALKRSLQLGVNFFDTAWAYGDGHSERLLGKLIEATPGQRIYVGTKVPPKNMIWPGRPQDPLEDTYPNDHVRRYTERSLGNLGVSTLDLLQFHVWDDHWAPDPRWQKTVETLKSDKMIRAFGISVNRWEPANVLEALRTGLVDVVQVVYNIFDQSPEEELFPLCRELDVAVIARVPFDEGTLTGTLTRESRFPANDWRSRYFIPENLIPSVERAERLEQILPHDMKLPELALRFILSEPTVSTVIPGMRRPEHVEWNTAALDRGPLPPEMIEELRQHRWDRKPAPWSA